MSLDDSAYCMEKELRNC